MSAPTVTAAEPGWLLRTLNPDDGKHYDLQIIAWAWRDDVESFARPMIWDGHVLVQVGPGGVHGEVVGLFPPGHTEAADGEMSVVRGLDEAAEVQP